MKFSIYTVLILAIFSFASCNEFALKRKPAVVEEQMGLQAIILGMGGTVQDFGRKSWTSSLVELFNQEGIKLTESEALQVIEEEPENQIRKIFKIKPSEGQVSFMKRWKQVHKEEPIKEDFNRLYSKLQLIRQRGLVQHADLISGALESSYWIRQQGWKIAAIENCSNEDLNVMVNEALKQGFSPDITVAADMVPSKSCRFYMILKACGLLGAASTRTVVIDDTISGIQAGNSAGCWTIFVFETGASVGLSEEEFAKLSKDQKDALLIKAMEKVKPYAHYLIPSIKQAPSYLKKIDLLVKQGYYPFNFSYPNSPPVPEEKISIFYNGDIHLE